MNKLIVFDLDGVLLDSKDCMDCSWEAVQRELGLSTTFDEYFARIGVPFNDILKDLDVPAKLWDQAREIYFKTSAKHIHLNRLFNGVDSCLARIKDNGDRVALLTSKSLGLTNFVLENYSLSGYLDCVCCPSTDPGFRGKPNPDQLFQLMLKFETDVLDTVYIGDMGSDYECAKRAGVKYIHAMWGYGQRPENHRLIANSVSELPDLINFLMD